MSISEEAPAQIRQRRDASWRCAQLETGLRDPLDALTEIDGKAPPRPRRRSTFKPAGITTDDRVILVRAFGAREALESGGMKPIFSARGRGWVLDAPKLPDAVAVLEHAGYRVTVRSRDAE